MSLLLFQGLALATMSAHASMVVLAVVQGLTEFLPVSSSGHLALGQILLEVGEGSLREDIALHLGTVAAVVAYYRRDLLELITGFFRSGQEGSEPRRYVLYLVIGNLPVVAVGLGARSQIEEVFDQPGRVLIALAVTGLMLLGTRWLPRRDLALDARRAFLIGLAQAVAILPGCSRSGWTIAAALALGLAPVQAARFSFLLSIPAILGASVLELSDVEGGGTPVSALLLGALVAALVGFLCLAWLVRLVRDMALHRFGYYLIPLAAIGGAVLLF